MKSMPICIGDLEALLLGQALASPAAEGSVNPPGNNSTSPGPGSGPNHPIRTAQPPQPRYNPLDAVLEQPPDASLAAQHATHSREELRAVIVLSGKKGTVPCTPNLCSCVIYMPLYYKEIKSRKLSPFTRCCFCSKCRGCELMDSGSHALRLSPRSMPMCMCIVDANHDGSDPCIGSHNHASPSKPGLQRPGC